MTGGSSPMAGGGSSAIGEGDFFATLFGGGAGNAASSNENYEWDLPGAGSSMAGAGSPMAGGGFGGMGGGNSFADMATNNSGNLSGELPVVGTNNAMSTPIGI